MAIKMRRGNKTDLDTSKLAVGEIAIVTDLGEVWAKVTSSIAKRLATLTSTGKLEQMPTAEDVGAVPSSQLFNLIYPVGSIYTSVNSTSPATLFGGTWEQMKDRFLLGAGDTYTAGATGGEATHVLTVGEMPSHTHSWKGTSTVSVQSSGTNLYPYSIFGEASADQYINQGKGPQAAGDGAAHNNMPPYLAVYMWKRTA